VTSGEELAAPAGPVFTAAAYALVLVLTVLLAVWGSFLVPFRVGGTLVPACWAVAVVGNVLLGRAAGRLAGRTGALVPALVWLAVAFTFGSKRAEGDLVVPGSTVGLVFLLVGALASAVAYALAPRRRAG
jgi:hypothetical protein